MRRCGECQLCCRLLPVRDLGKPANKRCKYQRVYQGCMIYTDRPPSCCMWSCVWLSDEAAKLRRPDRCHYVVDPVPDMIVQDQGEQHVPFVVLVVWCDPKYPDAHRDKSLREYALTHVGRGLTLVRYSDRDAILLVPPHLSTTGDWVERKTNLHEDLGRLLREEKTCSEPMEQKDSATSRMPQRMESPGFR